MTYKIDIATGDRTFYVSANGDDLHSGLSIENAVATFQKAIDLINALSPPSSTTDLTAIIGIGADIFIESALNFSDACQVRCESLSNNPATGDNIEPPSNAQTTFTTLGGFGASATQVKINNKDRVGLRLGGLLLRGTNQIGLHTLGTSNQCIIDIIQLGMFVDGGIGILDETDNTDPETFTIDFVSILGNNCTAFKHNPTTSTSRAFLNTNTIVAGSSTTGSIGILVENGSVEARVGDIDCATAIHVKNGASLDIMANVIIGNIIVDVGGTLHGIITKHENGTVTNNGTIHGFIDGTAYGPITFTDGLITNTISSAAGDIDVTTFTGGVFKFVDNAFQSGQDASNFLEIGHGGANSFINSVGAGNMDFRFAGVNKATFTSFGHLHLKTDVDQKHNLKIITANNLNDTGIAWENSGGAFTHTIFRTNVGSNRADLIFAIGQNADIDLLTNSFKIHGSVANEGRLEILDAFQISSGSPGLNKVLTSDAAGIATWEVASAGGWVDDGTVVRLATGSDSVGIGTTTPDGKFHIHVGSSGAVSASSVANALVVEDSTNNGISILTPAASVGRIIFGSPADPFGAFMAWSDSISDFAMGSSKVGANFRLTSDGETTNLTLSGGAGSELATFAKDVTITGQIKIAGGSPGNSKVLRSDANGLATWGDVGWTDLGTDVVLLDGGNKVGIGTATPDTKLHAQADGGSAGVVTAFAGTIATFESSGDGYLSILTPDAGIRGILFGEPSSNIAGGIFYNDPGSLDGFQFRVNGNVTKMVIEGDGKVGIGTTNPDVTALLDLTSTTLGFLGPRMTEIERDAIVSPAPGLKIHNTTVDKAEVFTGTTWKTILTEDIGQVLVQETFASTNVRFFGELGLPAAQGWTDVANAPATIDLVTQTVFGEVKQVVKHNDNSSGSTTSDIALTTQNWIDINAFGASYGGTSRLDSAIGGFGFFSGLQANSAENPLATGNRRYGVLFDNSGGNLRLREADNTGNAVIMDGTGGNPLITFDGWFSWECVVPAGLGAAELYINDILTTFVPTFGVNGGGLGTAIKVGSGSSGGTLRVVYHDNFGVTIYEAAATKTLSDSTMVGDVAQINIPEGKRDYTIVLPDENPRPIGAVLRLVANNLLGLISLENQNPVVPEILYNGLRTLVINVAVKETIEGINTVNSGNVYLGFQTSDIDRTKSIFIQLSSSVNQDPVDTNPTVITFNTQDAIAGITHSTTVNPGEITIVTEGVYFIAPQPQVGKTSGATKTDFDVFMQVDRGSGFVDEPNSNIKLTIKDSDITDVIVSAIGMSLNVGDKIRVMQRISSSSVGMGLKATAAEIGPPTIPATPAIILDMHRIGGLAA